MALREVNGIADPVARKAELLDRLDHVWKLAMERSYLNKRGKKVANPDLAIAERVVVTAAELVGVSEAAPTARRPVDLSVFNGGKGPQKATG